MNDTFIFVSIYLPTYIYTFGYILRLSRTLEYNAENVRWRLLALD